MKTTILGLLCAAAAAIQSVVQQGHDITDWKTWILPVALALLGYLAKDATPPPPALMLLVGLLLLFLPSCGGEYPIAGRVSYLDATTGAKAGVDFAPGGKPGASFRMPIKDANGNTVGFVDLRSGK